MSPDEYVGWRESRPGEIVRLWAPEEAHVVTVEVIAHGATVLWGRRVHQSDGVWAPFTSLAWGYMLPDGAQVAVLERPRPAAVIAGVMAEAAAARRAHDVELVSAVLSYLFPADGPIPTGVVVAAVDDPDAVAERIYDEIRGA